MSDPYVAALPAQLRATARMVGSQQVRDLLFAAAGVIERLAPPPPIAPVPDDVLLAAQVALCRVPQLPYMEWHADAERRAEAGEEQTYCQTCERWRWPDQAAACPRFVRSLAAEALAHQEVARANR